MSELVVGGKRVMPIRPAKLGLAVLALGLVALAVLAIVVTRAAHYEAPPVDAHAHASIALATSPPALTFGDSTFEMVGSIPVMRTTWAAAHAGLAHATFLHREVSAFLAAATPTLESAVAPGFARATKIGWRLRHLDKGLSDADRSWLAGLAWPGRASRGLHSYTASVRAAYAADLGQPLGDNGMQPTGQMARTLTVFGQVSHTPNKPRTLIGHTLALPGLADGGASAIPVVTIASSDKGTWAGVCWPGCVGTAFAMNQHGIVIAVHHAKTREVTPARTARAATMIARTIMEEASTLKDALRLLQQAKLMGSAAFVLYETPTGKSMVVEKSPEHTSIVQPAPPAQGDALSHQQFLTDPWVDRVRRAPSTLARTTRAAKLTTHELPTLEAFAAVLTDYRASNDARLSQGHRAAVVEWAGYALMADPVGQTLWVADSTGVFRAIPLTPLTAMPLESLRDLTPPQPYAFDVRARLQTTLQLVREARSLLRASHPQAAMEASLKALALSPSLPEAIAVGIDVARAVHNDTLATSLARQLLAIGNDQPGLDEERLRALAQ